MFRLSRCTCGTGFDTRPSGGPRLSIPHNGRDEGALASGHAGGVHNAVAVVAKAHGLHGAAVDADAGLLCGSFTYAAGRPSIRSYTTPPCCQKGARDGKRGGACSPLRPGPPEYLCAGVSGVSRKYGDEYQITIFRVSSRVLNGSSCCWGQVMYWDFTIRKHHFNICWFHHLHWAGLRSNPRTVRVTL